MVKALTVELENCYGIKKLKAQFDFSESSACAIYAPNGSMKSSLAQTFQDIADGAASKDRIFPARATKRSVKDDTGADLSKEGVLVVRPYDQELGHTAKTSTFPPASHGRTACIFTERRLTNTSTRRAATSAMCAG